MRSWCSILVLSDLSLSLDSAVATLELGRSNGRDDKSKKHAFSSFKSLALSSLYVPESLFLKEGVVE